MLLVSFDTPENIRKPEVLCFQGVSKETSGIKWVKSVTFDSVIISKAFFQHQMTYFALRIAHTISSLY